MLDGTAVPPPPACGRSLPACARCFSWGSNTGAQTSIWQAEVRSSCDVEAGRPAGSKLCAIRMSLWPVAC